MSAELTEREYFLWLFLQDARAAMLNAVDALAPDADPVERRRAIEIIEAQFDGIPEQDRMEAERRVGLWRLRHALNDQSTSALINAARAQRKEES